MDNKTNYGCGLGGLIGVFGFVVLCGMSCALLNPFYDNCMDDDIFHSIESNGRAIVHVYYDGKRVEVPGTVIRTPPGEAIPSINISEISSGVSMLSVTHKGKAANVKDSSFSDEVWSSKNSAFYFVEAKTNSVSEQKWLCCWTPTKGFEKLLELSGTVISVGLSLDQSAVVIDEYHPTFESQSCFVVFTLKDRRYEVIRRPDWAAHPVMIGPHRFLLRRHETGNYGHVVHWSPGQPDKDSANSDLIIGGATAIDIANLDGEIWALSHQGNKDSIVRLDQNLTRAVQDVGWVEEPEQPYKQP